MTMRVYRSSDAGAPVLRGNTPGDFINVLDKCLVTGYGTKLPAGWSKPFTGTNVAAFQQGAGSNEMFLRVDDTSTATANRAVRVVGYETMSDVNTGLPDSFPTEAQHSGGLRWFTGYNGPDMPNAREWMILADESFFTISLRTFPSNANLDYYWENNFFGDIIPIKPGDSTHTYIFGSTSASANTSSNSNVNLTTLGTATPGLYVARPYTNLGGSAPAGLGSNTNLAGSSFGNGRLRYPNPTDGGLWLAQVLVHETAVNTVRGILPGWWAPCHADDALVQGDTFSGSGDLAGRQFLWRVVSSSNAIVFETSDTWR